MWNQILLSFFTGLSVGPACIAHCGLFQTAYLARYAPNARRQTVQLGAALLGGRLAAYVLLGLVVGLVAGAQIWVVRPWVPTALLCGIMLLYAALPGRRASKRCACATGMSPTVVGGALIVGLLTGISPCPPMLASAAIALQSHGMAAAILVFLAFFAGSSLFLLPFVFGAAALSPVWRARLRGVSRVIAAAVALYAGSALFRQWTHAGGAGTTGPPPPPVAQAEPAPLAATGVPDLSGGHQADRPAHDVADPPLASPDMRPLYRKQRDNKAFTKALVQKLDLSLHEAMFYKPLPDGNVQCQLCPRGCTLRNGERGLCKVRVNIDGKLRALTYARPVSVRPDPIEKKPLFHVLPGSSALSVATVGCNSGCVFCQNFEISQALPEDVRNVHVPPEKLVAVAKQRGDEGIAYTYTEATVFYEYMLDTATLAKANGLKNYWITCGQIRREPLEKLCKVLDAANVDLKGFSDEFYVKYCDFRLQPVLDTLRTLKREGVFVEITNLIIPDANDDPEMIRNMCRWIVGELGPDTPLHFSRFHPAYKLTRTPPTPTTTLTMAKKIAEETGLRYVYIGNVRVHGAGNTRCPTCGKPLLRREGYLVLENAITHGACPHCKTPVAGIWE
jgi:pyruvate formate lyase activating enzyme